MNALDEKKQNRLTSGWNPGNKPRTVFPPPVDYVKFLVQMAQKKRHHESTTFKRPAGAIKPTDGMQVQHTNVDLSELDQSFDDVDRQILDDYFPRVNRPYHQNVGNTNFGVSFELILCPICRVNYIRKGNSNSCRTCWVIQSRRFKVGDIYPTNRSGNIEIMEYVDHHLVHIRFINTGYEKYVQSGNIGTGNIADNSLQESTSG